MVEETKRKTRECSKVGSDLVKKKGEERRRNDVDRVVMSEVWWRRA